MIGNAFCKEVASRAIEQYRDLIRNFCYGAMN